RPTVRSWLAYLSLAAGLALPWYATVALEDPDFLGYFFWRHNVLRYVVPFDHAKPAWYYVGDLTVGMLPWSFLLPALLKTLGRHTVDEARRRPAAVGFFLLAALWC